MDAEKKLSLALMACCFYCVMKPCEKNYSYSLCIISVVVAVEYKIKIIIKKKTIFPIALLRDSLCNLVYALASPLEVVSCVVIIILLLFIAFCDRRQEKAFR